MARPLNPRGPDDSAEIAEAANLFRDEPAESERPAAPTPKPSTKKDPGEYELVGGEDDLDFDGAAADIAMPPPLPIERPRRRYRNEDDEEERPTPVVVEEEVELEHIWTRWDEWWPTVLTLVGGALFLFWLIWVTFSAEELGRPILLLLMGGAVLLVLSYPILITLERPVRITPEQALQDYFDALSHWLPHYRRMWLLLGAPSQDEPPFHSFGPFQTYWKRRLGQIKSAHRQGIGPLVFKIAAYKSEKSGGKTTINARYTVEVRRGRGEGHLLATFRDSQRLVRGPDRMWYLTKARLREKEG
jgi:hypothetical protein